MDGTQPTLTTNGVKRTAADEAQATLAAVVNASKALLVAKAALIDAKHKHAKALQKLEGGK